LDNSCLKKVEFQRKIYFFTSFAYQRNSTKNAALQRSAMSIENGMPHSCAPAECYVLEITYPSAGADMPVHQWL